MLNTYHLCFDNKRNMHIIRCLLRERGRNGIALISVIISYVESRTRVDCRKGIISNSLGKLTWRIYHDYEKKDERQFRHLVIACVVVYLYNHSA